MQVGHQVHVFADYFDEGMSIVTSRISRIRVLVCCVLSHGFVLIILFMLVDNEGVSNSHKRLSSQGINSNF